MVSNHDEELNKWVDLPCCTNHGLDLYRRRWVLGHTERRLCGRLCLELIRH
jgi:hypothetical protein